MRKEKAGWPPRVKVGRGSPADARGRHPSGYKEKHVSRLSDLTSLDAKTHIVRLSGRLGERKRLMLLDKARQLNLKVANPGKIGTSDAGVPESGELAEEPKAAEELATAEPASDESRSSEDEST